jgi:hydroxyacylglutathione hydrolase
MSSPRRTEARIAPRTPARTATAKIMLPTSTNPAPASPGRAATAAGPRIEPIPAFRDNYIWLMEDGDHAVVVDPGAAAPVLQALAERKCTLDAIVVTHHHADHVGGVAELVKAHGARVYGPAASPFAEISDRVRQGDVVTLLGRDFAVLEVPGHTLDHVAFWSRQLEVLFCGDTLFACGCGRLFEGTAAQMYDSLARIAALPDSTRVYCAHEYTAANIRFALAVEPANAQLLRRSSDCTARRQRGEATVPSELGIEKQTNPFLRCNHATVRGAVLARDPNAGTGPAAVFAALRAWKDVF